jgi:pimeloyl-ACP methyl ester carboxylesterase
MIIKIATLSVLVSLGSLAAQATPNQPWIVLIPGASSSGAQSYPISKTPNRYFGGYEDALDRDGLDYIVCPETEDNDLRTIEEREEECATQIPALAARGNKETRDVVILAHSTGGLIARELGQDDRVKDRIKSIILFSTPNKGTVFADYILDQEAKGWNPSSIMAMFADWTYPKKHYLPELRSKRTGYPAETFASQDVIDNPEIKYMSFSTSFTKEYSDMDLTRMLIAQQIGAYGFANNPEGTTNDGVVPLYSEIYGEYLGNIEISHVEGACSDKRKSSAACAKSKAAVLPALEAQAKSL